MQKELDKFMEFTNNRKVRKQRENVLPTGASPNMAYLFPQQFEGQNCLQPVDVQIVGEILEDLKIDALSQMDWRVPSDFAEIARRGLKRFGLEEVPLQSAWVVFAAVLGFIKDSKINLVDN